MSKFENLVGKRFGKLEVVKLMTKTKNRAFVWLCKCDCGKYCRVSNQNLLSGFKTNCGCIKLPKNIEGMKFNRLKIIKFAGIRNRHKMYLCKCDCGKEVEVSLSNLKSGAVKSCGCLWDEYKQIGNVIHGLGKTRLCSIYHGIKVRCYRKTSVEYERYGGRGITMCDEWLDKNNGLLNFYNWAMANGYADNLTIDRIDNNGNYEPSNCRWATNLQQQNNTRLNHKYEYNGGYLTAPELSRLSGINLSTLRHRLRKYNNAYIALSLPLNESKRRYKKGE